MRQYYIRLVKGIAILDQWRESDPDDRELRAARYYLAETALDVYHEWREEGAKRCKC